MMDGGKDEWWMMMTLMAFSSPLGNGAEESKKILYDMIERKWHPSVYPSIMGVVLEADFSSTEVLHVHTCMSGVCSCIVDLVHNCSLLRIF